MSKSMWLICECDVSGHFAGLGELVTAAKNVMPSPPMELTVVLLHPHPENYIEELQEYEVDRILCVKTSAQVLWNDGLQARILASLIKERTPDIVLLLATVRGRSVAPQAAAQIGTGLTADCTSLELDEHGVFVQVRPAFGENLLARIVCKNHRPQMATIRPGVYVRANPSSLPVSCEVEKLNHEYESMDEVVLIESIKQVSRQLNRLSEAKIIIAGGRGIGGKQGFSLLGELANLFGGAVGASRGAVNAGYADYSMQVGQTGKIVRPAVYIAFGISGAVQHVVGMQASRKIITVNSDPRARIFDFADIGIVGDWESVARMMIQSLKEERNQEASYEFKKTL